MKKIGITCIIDDDPIYVFGIKKFISIHNFCDTIWVFENGEAAIEHLQFLISTNGVLPDIIILDVNMPIMDGWDFLDEFNKLKSQLLKNIKIHMVSSSIDKSDIERAESHNEVSGYFIKPIQLDDLKKIMQ
jgi:CheY-like chemotaxis protein